MFGKRRGRTKKAGPPVHDDMVRRDFTADGPNRLWLADITEHATGKGKLYLYAIKDVFRRRIVGYYIDARMKSGLAVTALDNAVARREKAAGCILHTDRGPPSSGHGHSSGCSTATGWPDRQEGSERQATARP
ncbi:DDE-type integrase/transposase/recombinase [Streptomyces sp. NBC_00203]|uniref:DDE-type integrase/transposase/recombinase n=1 Tax=Streptomyces sp. NBC_00203 TaxID=2975680 RepID=UPI003246728D